LRSPTAGGWRRSTARCGLNLDQSVVGGLHLLRVDLESHIGAAEAKSGHTRCARPREWVEHDYLLAGLPVRLDAPFGQFLWEAGEVRRTVDLLVGELPHASDRRCNPKRVLLDAGE
jgi:hypothetical protein